MPTIIPFLTLLTCAEIYSMLVIESNNSLPSKLSLACLLVLSHAWFGVTPDTAPIVL
jgi:hypothetical protein